MQARWVEARRRRSARAAACITYEGAAAPHVAAGTTRRYGTAPAMRYPSDGRRPRRVWQARFPRRVQRWQARLPIPGVYAETAGAKATTAGTTCVQFAGDTRLVQKSRSAVFAKHRRPPLCEDGKTTFPGRTYRADGRTASQRTPATGARRRHAASGRSATPAPRRWAIRLPDGGASPRPPASPGRASPSDVSRARLGLVHAAGPPQPSSPRPPGLGAARVDATRPALRRCHGPPRASSGPPSGRALARRRARCLARLPGCRLGLAATPRRDCSTPTDDGLPCPRHGCIKRAARRDET